MLLKVIIALSLSHFVAGGNVGVSDHDTDVGLKEVFERLSELEINFKRQADDNAALKQTVAALREENQELRNHVNMIQEVNKDMNNALKDLQQKVKQIDACDQKHSGQKHVNEHTKQLTYGGQETKIKDQSDGLRDQTKTESKADEKEKRGVGHLQRRENEQNVAFFATLGNHLSHLGANQNIAFDKVITNIGNGYNSHVGDFRAPVAGTYVFSVTLMAYGTSTTHYYIVKNTTHVANLYVRGSESPYASSSLTAVLELQKGEDIAIRNVDADKMLHGSYYSSFSGFLLDQTYSSSVLVGK